MILGVLSLTSCQSAKREADDIVKEVSKDDIFKSKQSEELSQPSIEAAYQPITMAFVGDVYLSDVLNQYYIEDGVSGFLSPSVKDVLQNSELTIMNHEYVATDSEAKVDYQLYTFKAPQERQVILKDIGVDIMSLANNHILDYGVEGLTDTMESLAALEIEYMGAGNNIAEAISPVIKEIQGKKIGFLAASRFIPSGSWYAQEGKAGVMATYESMPQYEMLLKEITRIKEEENCDFVVVYLHFGVEKEIVPEEYQRSLSYSYIDAGADLVIGSHVHRLQGIEYYKDKMICYNLGNFLFSNYRSDTAIIQITLEEDNSYQAQLIPCKSQNYKTEEVIGTEAEALYQKIEDISFQIEIDKTGNIKQIQP